MTKQLITSFFKMKGNTDTSSPSKAPTKRTNADVDGSNEATLLQKRRKGMSSGTEVDALIAPLFLKTGSTSGSEDYIHSALATDLTHHSTTVVTVTQHQTPSSWGEALMHHFQSTSFLQLARFVEQERKIKPGNIFPPPQETLACLTLTPLHRVRVVIVGQDPYHGPGQAHGLSFSVQRGQSIPPSLKNIYTELVQDTRVPNFTVMPKHGALHRWARQGVLLLNTVLTVRRGEPQSHKGRGWEQFTDEIIRQVDRQGRPVVFLLWGRPAATKTQALLLPQQGRGTKQQHHTIICTSHPSPLGARKTNEPFLGSKCFSHCNDALQAMGYRPIDWNVDGPLPEHDEEK